MTNKTTPITKTKASHNIKNIAKKLQLSPSPLQKTLRAGVQIKIYVNIASTINDNAQILIFFIILRI